MLDDFFGEEERVGLLEAITGSKIDSDGSPPANKWERNTADDSHASKTYGLRAGVLRELEAKPPPVMLEIQTRLASFLDSDHDTVESVLPGTRLQLCQKIFSLEVFFRCPPSGCR